MVVMTLAEPLSPPVVAVIVVVTKLLPVVVGERAVQLVYGALAPKGRLVQPDQVDGGQPDVPHQLVHGADTGSLGTWTVGDKLY